MDRSALRLLSYAAQKDHSLEPLDLDCEGSAIIRRTDNNLPVAKAWHSRFEASFIQSYGLKQLWMRNTLHHLQNKPFKKVYLENQSSQIMHRRLWPQVTGSTGTGRFWQTIRSSVHQEILFILWTLKVRHTVHKNPPFVPYAGPDQSNLPSYLLKISVYIIFPYLPARSKWSPIFRFTHQHSVCSCSLLHTFPMPHHLRRRYTNSETW